MAASSFQSELSPNRKFLLGTVEDFNPYRVVATITSGGYAALSQAGQRC